MKLYKTQTSPRWHASKTGLKEFDEIELPKEGRQGMADFLNANEVETQFLWDKQQHPQEYDPLEAAELRAVGAAHPPTQQIERVQNAWDATSIEEFILEHATVAQCENIFARLGTRFKELAKEAVML